MKYLSLNLLFLLFTTSLLAQLQFEKGYFINNQGDKMECLIKNVDWNNSPEHFFYKMDTDSAVMEASINDVKEFQIFDTNHYFIRHQLSNNPQKAESKIIKDENDLILMRVLIEGEASLYEYNAGRNYYFYQIGGKELTFFEYSKLIDDNNKIVEKHPYRRNLYDDLKCETFSVKTFSELNYRLGDLTDLFIDYNNCVNDDYTNFHIKSTKGKLNFKLLLKLNSNPVESHYSLETTSSGEQALVLLQEIHSRRMLLLTVPLIYL